MRVTKVSMLISACEVGRRTGVDGQQRRRQRSNARGRAATLEAGRMDEPRVGMRAGVYLIEVRAEGRHNLKGLQAYLASL